MQSETGDLPSVEGRDPTARATRRQRLLVCAGLALLFLTPIPAITRHDIPADITVRVIVRPVGETLRVLVRLPLTAISEVVIPTVDPGFVVIDEVGPALAQGADMYLVPDLVFFEDGATLPLPEIAATMLSIPADRSFASFDEALAHVTGPALPSTTQLHRSAAMMDVLLEYPIRSELSEFSMHPRFQRLALSVNTVLLFSSAEGVERAFNFRGNPGVVRLDPSWHQAAFSFVKSGFQHILDGIDHLLFLFCLMIPFRRVRTLVPIVTAFTVAHSITLIFSALGFAPSGLWFPPLVETLIALSIVWMAFENIVGATVRRRWIMAFAFGLVHGFGFSFALRETLQFAGEHLITSLLSFNVGVELGQIAVVIVLVPLLELLFRRAVPEKIGAIILSAVAAHVSWHWMTERGAELFLYDIPLPVLDGPFLSGVVLWAAAIALLGRLAWWGSAWLRPSPGSG